MHKRTFGDHFHWHIRKIDYDAHIPLFRTFGETVEVGGDGVVAVEGLVGIDEVKEASTELLERHKKALGYKHMIVLHKQVQSLSEQ